MALVRRTAHLTLQRRALVGLRGAGRRLLATTTPGEPDASVPTLDAPAEGTPTAEATTPTQRDGHLFAAGVFPVCIGAWDLRHYLGLFRQDALLAQLSSVLGSAPGLTLVGLEPHPKDGGVFVHVRYDVPLGTSEHAADAAWQDAQDALRTHVESRGGIPRWTGFGRGALWLVQGRPWREDMNRYSSPILRVAFDGPDVPEEALYALLRPYGRIAQLDMPSSAPPPPAGVPRAASVTFAHLRSAAVARNVLHGLDFQPPAGPSGAPPPRTRLRTAYQPPVQAHALRDWISKHPRIVGPVALFLLGSLTYTVWDPIRTLMVEGRMLDWFDYRKYESYQWLHQNVLAHMPWAAAPAPAPAEDEDEDEEDAAADEAHRRRRRRAGAPLSLEEEVWQERHAAEEALARYLADVPSTIAFLHGPAGSGKTRLLSGALARGGGRRTLMIDARALVQRPTDAALVGALAEQTGYWPAFTFLSSFGNWIDLASVGLIGQKAGFATSAPDQVRQVLAVVGTALGGVSASVARGIEHKAKKAESKRREEGAGAEPRMPQVASAEKPRPAEVMDAALPSPIDVPETKEKAETREELKEDGKDKQGSWLPSLPAVSLPALPAAVSDITALPGRLFRSATANEDKNTSVAADAGTLDPERVHRAAADAAVRALPVVVLKNFERRGGAHKDADEVLDALAAWAAALVDGGVAHVIVVSEKRDNSKRLAQALPTKPLATITLADADPASALAYVQQQLAGPGAPPLALGAADAARLEQLGGPAADLARLVRKVRAGEGVAAAVEDLVVRDAGAVRKAAFGDDAEDGARLRWTPQQAWRVLRALAGAGEAPYYALLADVFGGDEGALRALEHAELVAVSTDGAGRPAAVRPGKPVYKHAFARLVNDPVFAATQDLALNAKAAAGAVGALRAAEDELLLLAKLASSRAVRRREDHLLDELRTAQAKLEALAREAAELKKVLAKGG